MTAEEQVSGDDRAAITAELLRLGLISGAGDSEEVAIVEALSTI